jgi:hypothetical protein
LTVLQAGYGAVGLALVTMPMPMLSTARRYLRS